MEPTSREMTAETPSHKGILREETVALRQLLGYGRSTEASLRLNVPELGTNLPGSSMRDVLLVGLDVDTFQGYEELIPDQQLHVGISILDTRRIHELLVSSLREGEGELTTVIDSYQLTGELAAAIDSYQLTIGSSRYCRRARNKFLFGQSKSAASISELKLELEHLVEGRDSILVFHGAECDLKMLRHLDVDLRPLYIIDTNKAAQYPLQLWYRYGLEKLLDVLEIPYALLHAAGNDARFCLQALLMLAVKDAEMSQPGAAADNALLRLLKGISQAPRPSTLGEIEAALAPARLAAKEAKAATAARRKQRRAARQEQRRLERERREHVAEGSDTKEPNDSGG